MTAYQVGFSPRKARILAQFAGEPVRRLLAGRAVKVGDRVYAWGDIAVPSGPATVIRVEDGFLRSVGLGAAFADPVSWVFDEGGLHHRADQPTRLESIIQSLPDDQGLHARAQRFAAIVRRARLTKYNLGTVAWQASPAAVAASRRLLVIGQVSNDAALSAITTPVNSNIGLLRAVRERHPDSFIVYKRHPDVVAGLREGNDREALQYADEVVGHAAVDALLGWASEVHVMNSLFGFEALIRGALVVCHAAPFYAGWGLTDDRLPLPRRHVKRSLEQLIAAALILYPRYRNPATQSPCSPEEALDILIESRMQREVSPIVALGGAIRLRLGRLFKTIGRLGKAPA